MNYNSIKPKKFFNSKSASYVILFQADNGALMFTSNAIIPFIKNFDGADNYHCFKFRLMMWTYCNKY